MGKKKTRNRKTKTTISPEEYEGYSYGSIKVEKLGRAVLISSNWQPKQFEQHIQRLKAKRPQLKKEIDKKIRTLISMGEQFDPLELLSPISIQNCLYDAEAYKESTHEGRECYAEYAQSILLGQKKPGFGNHAPDGEIAVFNKLVAEIFGDILAYFGTEVTEGKRDTTEEELRFMSIMRYLFIRGSSYPEHHIALVRDVFRVHDPFLKKTIGFTTDEVIAAVQEIESQIEGNVKGYVDVDAKLRELHALFKEFIEEKGVSAFSSIEECREKYNALPEVQERSRELETLYQSLQENPFVIRPTENVPEGFLRLLSSQFGDNASFNSFEKTPGWPTNDSVIPIRPLIKHDGACYCFLPQLLFRNIGNILEAWVKAADNSYFQKTYQKKRAHYLEKKALVYFKAMLPDARTFQKLFYRTAINGEQVRLETDGIVLYDTNLFIIEGKAGELSTSARRGGLERMKRDAAELIGNAYCQGLRTKQFILNAEKPLFEHEDGSEALVIEDKGKYDNIYLVNVTLEHLGQLSTQLHSLKAFDLIQGREWPWSVFINDLRIISELIESPSEFLHFLRRRIRANDYPQFHVADELVFLMFYFYEGLYFEDGVLGTADKVTLHAYTEDLDRYYDYLAGRVSNGKKPRLRIPEKYRKLVTSIESLGKDGFTRVTTTLLGFDKETQREILANLKRARQLSERDGHDHDVTMYFKGLGLGLMFSVGTNRKPGFCGEIDRHCRMKMYQTRLENWIFITIDISKEGQETLDFRIYEKKWEFDPDMESHLKEFKKWKMDQFLKTHQKIRRNDPCPCDSGLKYKKCCGKGYTNQEGV